MENLYLKDQGKSSLPLNIAGVEKKYNAKFVGDFCLKTKNGWQQDSCGAVFWQEKPPVEGYSHYFALIFQYTSYSDPEPTLFITNGASAFEKPIVGIVADNGEVVHSRYAHDFRSSTDGSVCIDGGQDYVRLIGDKSIRAPQVHIVVEGPNITFKPIEVIRGKHALEVEADLSAVIKGEMLEMIDKELKDENNQR